MNLWASGKAWFPPKAVIAKPPEVTSEVWACGVLIFIYILLLLISFVKTRRQPSSLWHFIIIYNYRTSMQNIPLFTGQILHSVSAHAWTWICLQGQWIMTCLLCENIFSNRQGPSFSAFNEGNRRCPFLSVTVSVYVSICVCKLERQNEYEIGREHEDYLNS